MKKIMCSIFISLTFNVHQALANYEVERLMDSYLVAKADAQQFPLSESEIKDTPYTIQVASYINEKDAVSHVEELKLQEKDVLYFPSFVRGQVWFKVCVGKFAKKDKADEYRKAFIKRADEPFAVVISLLDRPKAKTTAMSDVKLEEVRKPASDPLEVKLISKKKAVAPAAATVQGHKYSIQIGAYNTEDLAKEKIKSLSIKDHEVYYKAALVNGKQWYRIFVGSFESKKAAEVFQKKYTEQAGGAESFIRRVTASE